jgi:ankyrin repeat protein
MYRFSSKLFSYPETLPSDLLIEILLKLPPKDILFLCSRIKDFERGCSQYKFWERVWLKWVSSRLPNWSNEEIKEEISRRVEEAKRLTPEKLLEEGSKRGILFYVIEALERGADISAKNNEALWSAAARGYLDVVKYLVEHGANVSANEDMALRSAAYFGHFDVVKYLVEKGANISAREDEALRNAAFFGYFDIVKYLVEKGANISARDNEALREASYFGHFDIVKYLTERGEGSSFRGS